jgi:glucose/arabinose dehydrogenase
MLKVHRIQIAKPVLAHTPLALFLACTFSFAAIRDISAAALPDGFAEREYAQGLTNPTAMAFAPDPCPASGTPVHRLFVCEQAGTVRVFRNGVLQPTPFLTVHTETCDERGLDGICFDPNFATNHYVYIYYTVFQSADSSLPTHNRLSRFTADPANPDVALPGSETPIMEMDTLVPYPYCIHNGGAMHFGPDGKLYVAVGNNGVNAHSQDYGTVLGKILRIDPVPGQIRNQHSPSITHSTTPPQGKIALSTSLGCAIRSPSISSRALDGCSSMTLARRLASASLRALKEEITAGQKLSVQRIRQSLG